MAETFVETVVETVVETGRARRAHIDLGAGALLVLLCALWGLQQVSVKLAVAGGLPPILQAGLRSLIAVSLVFVWTVARGGRKALRAWLRPEGTLTAGLATAAVFAAEFALLFPGLSLTTASRGVLFLYTAPFFTALGAHLFLPGERLRLRPVCGLGVAFCGVGIAFAQGLGQGAGSVAGDGLCLLAAVLWASNTIIVKASRSLSRAPVTRVLAYQLGGALPILLLTSAVAGETWHPAATILAWGALLYQAVAVAFASYLAWFWLVLVYPATRIAGFTFLTPVFGIAFGALILDEPIGSGLVLGVLAIAVGLRLLNPRAQS